MPKNNPEVAAGLSFATRDPLLTLPGGLTIRPLLHSDAAKLVEYCDNIKIARNMTDRFPHPYTLDDAHGFIAYVRDTREWRDAKSLGDLPLPASADNESPVKVKVPQDWALALDGELIGVTGLILQSDTRRRVAVFGYWIAEPLWGRGYATQLMQAFIAWAWKAYPDLDRIEATVHSWNPASMSVLRKLGFVEEGRLRAGIFKMGKRCDSVTFGLVRDGVEIDIEPPT